MCRPRLTVLARNDVSAIGPGTSAAACFGVSRPAGTQSADRGPSCAPTSQAATWSPFPSWGRATPSGSVRAQIMLLSHCYSVLAICLQKQLGKASHQGQDSSWYSNNKAPGCYRILGYYLPNAEFSFRRFVSNLHDYIIARVLHVLNQRRCYQIAHVGYWHYHKNVKH